MDPESLWGMGVGVEVGRNMWPKATNVSQSNIGEVCYISQHLWRLGRDPGGPLRSDTGILL